MRVSLRWLRELLTEIPNNAKLVSETLTSIGLAVDAVYDLSQSLRPIQVVEVRSIARHPRRDQLQLVDVDRGGGHLQQVVCGASNVPAPGSLVLLAPLGAQLPGMEGPLAAREMGGVKSEGMFCSETELGVAIKYKGLSRNATGTMRAWDAGDCRAARVRRCHLRARHHAESSGRTFTYWNSARPGCSSPCAVPTSDCRCCCGRRGKCLDDSVAIDNQDGERCPDPTARPRLSTSRLGLRRISCVGDCSAWAFVPYPM